MEESSSTRATSRSVMTHRPRPHALPSYIMPGDRLEFGASLGNSALWVTTKGTGAIDGVFSVDSGQSLTNAISIRYAGPGRRPLAGAMDDRDPAVPVYVGLRPDEPGTVELHPAYQRRRFAIGGCLNVVETIFLPLTGADDPPVVYQTVEMHNHSPFPHDVRVFGFARLRGTLADDVAARYDAALHALVAHNKSQPQAVRVFGLTEEPSGFAASFDYGRVYTPMHIHTLDNRTDASGDILGCLQLDAHLAPDETRRFAFVTAVSNRGEDAAMTVYRDALDYDAALDRTLAYLAGLRTASRNDPLYDPNSYVGLIGGVWPGLTWRYAFAAARYHPEFMVAALRSSFEHYAADPKANNTVPGQFSEWFDGESLVNRGMRLSPWEPPRFLWAAVEGVCGLTLTPSTARVNPLIPPDWKWVALRRLPYHGREITYFAARQGARFHLYANADIETTHHKEIYDEDISTRVHAFSASAEVVALRRPGEIMALVGNVGEQTSVVPLNLQEVLDADASYDLRIYSSEHKEWQLGTRETGRTLTSLAVPIESNGFRAIELKQVRA
jgi:hypothetical protein